MAQKCTLKSFFFLLVIYSSFYVDLCIKVMIKCKYWVRIIFFIPGKMQHFFSCFLIHVFHSWQLCYSTWHFCKLFNELLWIFSNNLHIHKIYCMVNTPCLCSGEKGRGGAQNLTVVAGWGDWMGGEGYLEGLKCCKKLVAGIWETASNCLGVVGFLRYLETEPSLGYNK